MNPDIAAHPLLPAPASEVPMSLLLISCVATRDLSAMLDAALCKAEVKEPQTSFELNPEGWPEYGVAVGPKPEEPMLLLPILLLPMLLLPILL